MPHAPFAFPFLDVLFEGRGDETKIRITDALFCGALMRDIFTDIAGARCLLIALFPAASPARKAIGSLPLLHDDTICAMRIRIFREEHCASLQHARIMAATLLIYAILLASSVRVLAYVLPTRNTSRNRIDV